MKLDKVYPQQLRKELKYIYVLKSEGKVNVARHLHLPDGTWDLIINLGEPIYNYDYHGLKMKMPDLLILGGFRSSFYADYTGHIHLIGVVFQFGHGARIINDRLDKYPQANIPAHLVFGSEIYHLREQLFICRDQNSIVVTIENFLKKRLNNKYPYYLPRITQSVDLILGSKGNIRTSEIRDHVCMSERNFRRIFSEFTGFSPKELVRIIRVKNLIHCIKKGYCLREIAYLLGYFDTAHLIHDFKSISRLTPKVYHQQLSIIDQSFFKISEYAR